MYDRNPYSKTPESSLGFSPFVFKSVCQGIYLNKGPSARESNLLSPRGQTWFSGVLFSSDVMELGNFFSAAFLLFSHTPHQTSNNYFFACSPRVCELNALIPLPRLMKVMKFPCPVTYPFGRCLGIFITTFVTPGKYFSFLWILMFLKDRYCFLVPCNIIAGTEYVFYTFLQNEWFLCPLNSSKDI